MPTPRLNSLSILLSRMVNDEVSNATDNGAEYSANLRLLALNKAMGKFIAEVAIKDIDTIIKDFQPLLRIRQRSTLIEQKELDSPAEAIRVLHIQGQGRFYIYTHPDGWFHLDYNEENEAGNIIRWTEIGSRLYFNKNLPLGAINLLILLNHEDLVYNGEKDVIIPLRYETDILRMAYEFLTLMLVKE